MSETNETLVSLRSSIEALHARLDVLHAQVAAKADTSAVSALSSRVTSCEGHVAAAGSQVAAQSVTTTALGNAVASPGNKADSVAVEMLASRVTGQSNHSGYVTGEKPARQAMEEVFSRAEADLALAKRIGSFECKLPEGTVKATLAAETPSDEGANEISDVTVKDSVIDPAPFKVEAGKLRIDHVVLDDYNVKIAVNERGQFYVAGVGLGVSQVTSGLKLGPGLEEDVRRLIRGELAGSGADQPNQPSATDLLEQTKARISESQLATELEGRIALIEQGQAQQGRENRAVHDRLVDLASRAEALTALVQSEVSARIASESSLAAKVDALQSSIGAMQGNTTT